MKPTHSCYHPIITWSWEALKLALMHKENIKAVWWYLMSFEARGGAHGPNHNTGKGNG